MQNYGEPGDSIDTFFDSFTEFLDMCDDATIPDGSIGKHLFDDPPKRRDDAASRRGEDYQREDGFFQKGYIATWSGAKDWPETLDFAYRRWDKGREFMQRYKQVIEHDLEGITFKKEFMYDVAGSGVLDVPRHLQGMPDPFLVDHDHDVPVNDKGRVVVRILYNGTTVAGCSAEQMMLKGAMVTTLVDLLEANGRRCEVMVGYCLGGYAERLGGKKIENYRIGSPGVYHTIMIPVKTPSQALNQELMFFALGCPAMQRRLVFSLQERYIQPIRTVFNYDGHYGMVTDFQKEEQQEWDIIIPATVPMNNNAQWKKWLLEKLREQGIEVVE